MQLYYVTVTRTLQQSASVFVRAHDTASATAQAQAYIDTGVIWEEFDLDVQELDHSVTIEEVDEA